MNLEQVGHFIRHPQELQLSDADALKNLASRHPYSSVYALLYLTALANGKSPELDDALSANAYRLSDRTRLYHLLTQDAEGLKGVEEVEKVEEIQVDQNGSKEDQKVEIVEQVETGSKEDQVEKAEGIQEDQNGSKKDQKVEEDQSGSKDQIVQGTEIAEKPESVEKDDEKHERKSEAEIGFDFEKITTAHSLEQYLEVEEGSKEVQKVEGVEEVQKGLKEDQSNSTEIQATEETQQTDPVQHDEKRSFTSWLRSANSENVPVSKPAEPVVQKPKANELIDRFIKEEPSITRSKTDFFSPSKKAKESLSEDTAPVSETLAKIYAAQGNYPKAIHVYHQLMLSVPEKKSLFAVRIEELKKKITQ